jgi:hypothetical protein
MLRTVLKWFLSFFRKKPKKKERISEAQMQKRLADAFNTVAAKGKYHVGDNVYREADCAADIMNLFMCEIPYFLTKKDLITAAKISKDYAKAIVSGRWL